MYDIPTEVFREILSRLPANLLLQFRCVSKSWRDAIDDPIFTRLHLDHQIQHSSNGVGHLILRCDLRVRLYSLSFDSLKSEIVQPIHLNHNPSYGGTKSMVCSCNGIMVITDLKGTNYLWNPLTRESHKLPTLKVMMSRKSKGLYLSVTGVGYDCIDDDYKVVKIAQVFDPRDRILESETVVYSLRLDSWTRIKDFPYRIWRSSGGVYLRGALHWISSTMPQKCIDDLIIGLDLTTEDYSVMTMPSELSGVEKPSAKHLGVLGGCLVLSCYYQIERFDVWVMKDYRVKSSWIKLFSIGAVGNIVAVETLRPLAYSECKGEVLLQHDKKEFLWFNIENNLGRKITILNGPATFSSQFHLASLVRLNRGVGMKTRPAKGKTILVHNPVELRP